MQYVNQQIPSMQDIFLFRDTGNVLASYLIPLFNQCLQAPHDLQLIRPFLAQTISTTTQGQMQLCFFISGQHICNQDKDECKYIASFPLVWGHITYGMLHVKEVQDSQNLYIALQLSHWCSWILRLLEDAAYLHTRTSHISDEHISLISDLTEREREILTLMIHGHKVDTIAHILSLSKRTVEKHRESIYRRLNTTTSQEAELIGLIGGILTAEI